MQPITDQAGFDHLAALPIALLLKHGARCPISANARNEVTRYAAAHPDIPVFSLEVVENGMLSRDIAGALGVKHESPQLFLLERGTSKWHTEHYDITADEVASRLASA